AKRLLRLTYHTRGLRIMFNGKFRLALMGGFTLIAIAIPSTTWYMTRQDPWLSEAAPVNFSRPPQPPEPPAETYELPQAEREYIWEIEHHGNVLVKHGFQRLADALKQADAKALSALLADDFKGADLNAPLEVRAQTAYAQVERQQDAGNT